MLQERILICVVKDATVKYYKSFRAIILLKKQNLELSVFRRIMGCKLN